jgi:hypothetical protein
MPATVAGDYRAAGLPEASGDRRSLALTALIKDWNP